jgi:hypothetical protein
VTELQQILDRAIKDPAFSARLKNDTEGALKDAGIEATPQKVSALKESVASLLKTHEAFGGRPKPD